jgi:hypothetical protein
MGDFDDVDNATTAAVRLPKLTEGEYLLEVTNNESKKTFKYGKAIFREFIIREAKGEKALPAGTMAKAKPLYFSDTGFGARLKEYVVGLTGTNNVTSKDCEALFAPSNPAKGTLVRAIIEADTSDAGREFLRYTWVAVPGQK